MSEGVGKVNFTYRVLQGELGYSVAVNFYTSEGSATSKNIMMAIASMSLYLSGAE